LKIKDDGKIDSQFAALPMSPMPTLDGLSNGLLGLATYRGDIFAALDSDVAETHGVYKISKRGKRIERLAGSASIHTPNALAFDNHHNLYVTDSLDGAVWRFYPDNIKHSGERWVQHDLLTPDPENPFGLTVTGANGIAFANGSLFVANTSRNSIVRIGIDSDGSPQPAELFAVGAPLFTVDGIAAAADGLSILAAIPGFAVLSALNQSPFSPIVQVDTQTREITPVPVSEADKALFETPLSLTLGPGGRSVFVTNGALPDDDVFATIFGFPQPGPSIVEVGVGHPAFAASAVVPEPSTVLLVVLSAGALVLRMPFKRRSSHVISSALSRRVVCHAAECSPAARP
jgi:hypothetical protein